MSTAGDVQLIELVKRYGEVTAVDGIDLHIAGGEFFTMLGRRAAARRRPCA